MPLQFESIPYSVIPWSVWSTIDMMLKLTMSIGSVARCMEKFIFLQNWSNEINIDQLSLKYGTMKL